LLLLRAGVGQTWHPAAVAERLYIQPTTAASLLHGLHERELIMLADPAGPTYRYAPATSELVRLVEELAASYAKHLVAVTNLIHCKTSGSVQGFADAFRIREDK
jgi:hypothetical protein